MFTPVPDRFDEVRREWIARHAGMFTMQKRRAEVLNRQIRDRNRRLAGARPNPHDDNVIHPLTARRPTTVEAHLELALVCIAAVVAPLGWPLGHLLYRRTVGLIPDRLRSYPIAAPLWTGMLIGALTVLLYDPGTSLRTALLAPYVLAQIPAAFVTASLYGILNGWLAVDGAADWWPVTPPPPPVDLDLPMSPDDMTAPGVFHTHDAPAQEDRTPIKATSGRAPSALPITAALVLTAIGIAWTITTVALGVKTVVNQQITTPAVLTSREPTLPEIRLRYTASNCGGSRAHGQAANRSSAQQCSPALRSRAAPPAGHHATPPGPAPRPQG